MTKQFLITRPMHDKETSYLYSFSKAIVRIVKEDKNIHLTELEGEKANRYDFESAMRSSCPTLAYLNGHGDEKVVFGHENNPILDFNNVKLTKDKIICALACSSLVELGQLAIESGAKVYIGYKDEFMWVGDPSKSAVPDKNKNAAPFRKVCHMLINSLVCGEPAGKAIEKTKIEYKKLIKSYGNSEDNPFGDAPAIGLALSWDLICLDLVGDLNTTF